MIEAIRETTEVVAVYNLRVASFHTYFVGCQEWGFSVWAHNLGYGDAVSRTTASGAIETVNLPAINMAHLTDMTVNAAGRVEGFHVMPASVGPITSTSPFTLPAGSIQILDASGNPITGATVRVTPLRVPATTFDSFAARIEVFDSSGARIGLNVDKTFYPQGWTAAQIEQGIYSAYAQQFQSGGPVFAQRLMGTTPEGVEIIMRVNGGYTGGRPALKEIPTAYLRSGQNLDATHVPK
jgi:hypothetical protein